MFVADHLSQIDNDETSDDSVVDDNFPGQTLMEVTTNDTPWFADFAHYLVGDVIPKGMTYQQKNKFFSDLKNYFWEDPYLFKVVRILQKSQENGQNRTNTNTGTEEHTKSPRENANNGQLKSTFSQTSTGNKANTLEGNSQRMQRPDHITDCHTGNPCELEIDLTAKSSSPIIEGMYGQDWKERAET
ncbi:hypothetical protein Tco_0967570 [Tanacetum coccineum]